MHFVEHAQSSVKASAGPRAALGSGPRGHQGRFWEAATRCVTAVFSRFLFGGDKKRQLQAPPHAATMIPSRVFRGSDPTTGCVSAVFSRFLFWDKKRQLKAPLYMLLRWYQLTSRAFRGSDPTTVFSRFHFFKTSTGWTLHTTKACRTFKDDFAGWGENIEDGFIWSIIRQRNNRLCNSRFPPVFFRDWMINDFLHHWHHVVLNKQPRLVDSEELQVVVIVIIVIFWAQRSHLMPLFSSKKKIGFFHIKRLMGQHPRVGIRLLVGGRIPVTGNCSKEFNDVAL